MSCPSTSTWATSGSVAALTLVYIVAHYYLHRYIYFFSWAPVRVLALGVMWSFSDTSSSNLAFYISYVGFASSSLFLILTRLTSARTNTVIRNTCLSLIPSAVVIALFLAGQTQFGELTSIAVTATMGIVLMYIELAPERPPPVSTTSSVGFFWTLAIVSIAASFTFLSSYLECMDMGIWAGLVASMPLHNTMSLLFLVERGTEEEVIHVWSLGEVIHIANFTILIVLAYLEVELQNLHVLHRFSTWTKLSIVVSVISACTLILVYILHFLFLSTGKLQQREKILNMAAAVPTLPIVHNTRQGLHDTRTRDNLRL